jgi:predicted glutamine amidotransferase
MSRLFAWMGNDPARVACALHPARKALVVPAETPGTKIDSWGIGFYQGEVLLQRRPKAPTEELDFYEVARELRTDAIIGHARAGTVGKPKNENTHPFRFRSWMFAHHGTVPDYPRVHQELLSSVPDFLARNIRGQTDSEVLFHLFLAYLHGTNKLDEGRVSTAMVRDALRSTLKRVEELSGADAWKAGECALAVTNGRILVATRHGAPVNVHRVDSITDCAVCREQAPQFGRDKRIDHEHLRSILIVADAPAPSTVGSQWSEVPPDSFAAVNHDLHVEITPIA